MKLKPVVVSIANDPDATADVAGLPRRPSRTPLEVNAQYDASSRIFGLLKAPVDALIATRAGHAAEVEQRAEDRGQNFFYRIRIAQVPDLTEDEQADDYDKRVCKTIWAREK